MSSYTAVESQDKVADFVHCQLHLQYVQAMGNVKTSENIGGGGALELGGVGIDRDASFLIHPSNSLSGHQPPVGTQHSANFQSSLAGWILSDEMNTSDVPLLYLLVICELYIHVATCSMVYAPKVISYSKGAKVSSLPCISIDSRFHTFLNLTTVD